MATSLCVIVYTDLTLELQLLLVMQSVIFPLILDFLDNLHLQTPLTASSYVLIVPVIDPFTLN